MAAWFKRKEHFNDASANIAGGDIMRAAYQKQYYDRQTVYIEDFFRRHNLIFSKAYFDKLKDLKKDGLRKDNETPDTGHEIDQLLNFIIQLDRGSLSSPKAWKTIEKEHGSIDALLTAVISHDIKEDFGLFTEDLYQEILDRISRIQKSPYTTKQQEVLWELEHRSEDLTHYRKFTPEEFEKLTSEALPKLNKKDKVVGLEQYIPFFSQKINRIKTDQDYYNPNVYAEYNKEKKKWTVFVTAYGRGAPEYGVDWNGYIMQVNRDVFTGITKLGDRINGIATRIAVNEGAKEYDDYLDATDFMFKTLKSVVSDYTKNFSDGPFGEFMRNQTQTLGLLLRMGQMVVQHHKYKNDLGGKGWSPITLKKAMERGENPSDFEEFFPGAIQAHKGMLLNSNPIVTFFRQLKDYVIRSQDQGIGCIYEAMLDAVGIHGGRTFEKQIRHHIDNEFPPSPKPSNVNQKGTSFPFLTF